MEDPHGASPPERRQAADGPRPALQGEAHPLTRSRAAVAAATRRPEPESVAGLLDAARLSPAASRAAHAQAATLVQRVRSALPGAGREGLVQGLIQAFSLSSQEGVALMCLAEALLRIPDAPTRDALIRDKIGTGDWQAHLGQSRSLFVNAATWGLLITGRLVATHPEGGLANALTRLLAKGGEPVVRRGVDMAMRLMGEQFVTGQTIEEALRHAREPAQQRFRYSFDMLGEAALTAPDADRYLAAYRHAIEAIGHAAGGRGPHGGPGISIKLSALHPRYGRAQRDRVHAELYPRLLELTLAARRHDIGLNIDAEEAERLELSLDLLERLCAEAALEGWQGIGFVVQAYQKRCGPVIEHLVELARRSRHRLMVRLVKGAYWDSEIKRAQVDGLVDYPVHTRKAHTDVSYLAAARRLLAAPAEIFPQFATHNAHTVAAIEQFAGGHHEPGRYEYQCLHGMGEPLYRHVVAPVGEGGLGRPCRIYAPVGSHESLLAYLVRRLLENGANTSFVHRLRDDAVAIDDLLADPVEQVERSAAAEGVLGARHPAIPLPPELYRPLRANSVGVDLASDAALAVLAAAARDSAATPWRAAPAPRRAADATGAEDASGALVTNPADARDVIGRVLEATAADTAAALEAAVQARAGWQATSVEARAAMLEGAADRLQAALPVLVALLVREAGKTHAAAVAEVREAVDFLRYDAVEARREAVGRRPAGSGVAVCISPWNFPLAIFVGQVAAALAAGHVVLTKPAEQTPLIAAEAVRLLHDAGVPAAVVQLLPGRGERVGAALVADARVGTVLFTGSNAVARALQRALAGRVDADGRPATLIAETGGQNALVVDSSALLEQVVADVLASAFDSAGQRCSALRVLCLQQEIAEPALQLLLGAMRELRVGPPGELATDVGPVIDADARDAVERHVTAMRAAGRRVHRPVPVDPAAVAQGSFVAPALIELERIDELTAEVFGPVLHVVRYARDRLGDVVDAINATGYGLTMGVHSRIDETIAFVLGRARAGNLYVNRNMVGAVVGVQPFGGEGLSGTGPKAGGPLYLRRLLQAPRPWAPRGAADGLAADGPSAGAAAAAAAPVATLRALRDTLAHDPARAALAAACDVLAARSPAGASERLPGPTGERNTWALVPRELVLCLAEDDAALLLQTALVLAVGGRPAWLAQARVEPLRAALPASVQARVLLVGDELQASIDAALITADAAGVARWSRRLAERDGPIVALHAVGADAAEVASAFPLERLMVERTVSVNTAAAGGNATLMAIG